MLAQRITTKLKLRKGKISAKVLTTLKKHFFMAVFKTDKNDGGKMLIELDLGHKSLLFQFV